MVFWSYCRDLNGTLRHAGACGGGRHYRSLGYVPCREADTDSFPPFFLPTLADRGIVAVVVDGSCGVNNDNKPYAENIYQYATKMGRSTVT